jgi:hypothetical protein
MQHQIITVNEYKINLDYSVVNSLKPFKEEVLDELYNTHKLHGEMPVLFSGGMDSTFIVRSLMELGLRPRTISFSFSKNNDDYDCELAKNKCKKYGLPPPEFFYMDERGFFDHLEYLFIVRNTAYPMMHGYFMDYFLKSNKYSKFYSGLSCEYKLKDNKVYMPPGPVLIKQNNPNQVYGFTTDRTFLSYFKNEIFKDNYKKPIPLLSDGSSDAWYIRDLIYMDCYPDMNKERKEAQADWRKYIVIPFWDEIFPLIEHRFPLIYNSNFNIKPCEFDIDFLVNL